MPDQPPPRSPRHRLLSVIAFACATVSILALLLNAVGLLPMYFMVEVLGPPSVALLIVLGVFARQVDEGRFLNRLVTGTWAGLVATFAYDGLRLVLWKGGLFGFNPFLSHPIFGNLITHHPVTSRLAIDVGWGYHFWNGITFGIMYTLVAGRGKWYYGLVWALFLEIGWLLALPRTLHMALTPQIITLSLIGHAAYGITLGLLSQKYVKL